MKTGEFRQTHERLEALLADVHRACEQPHVDRLIREIRDEIAADWRKAQDAVNSLVRTQVAQGLAPLFLTRKQPYKDHPDMTAMIAGGLLHPATFIQKSPYHLKFYRQVLASLGQEPRSILEIGVKGGGSTAFWKALFAAATVVGIDIKLRPGLAEPSADGVIYLQADQTDVKRLREIAGQYGPFDFGEDIWADFTLTGAAAAAGRSGRADHEGRATREPPRAVDRRAHHRARSPGGPGEGPRGVGVGYNCVFACPPESERYRSGRNGGASKASCPVRGTWVRIPPSPPINSARKHWAN